MKPFSADVEDAVAWLVLPKCFFFLCVDVFFVKVLLVVGQGSAKIMFLCQHDMVSPGVT